MAAVSLPKKSWTIIALSVVAQCFAIGALVSSFELNIPLLIAAFFIGTYLADLNTAIFHFGFDYVWPDNFPIMGPISLEFRRHHDRPTLDPSDMGGNLTRGAYMGLTF